MASPKPVAVVPVQRDSVRRAVDVVGTLTAVDQVTVSSEAEGTVRAILADLGDRVTGGSGARSTRQREAAVRLPTAAGGARSHARAVRRHRSTASARTGKYSRRAEGQPPSSRRPKARSTAPASSSSASSSRSRPSTTRRQSCRPKQAGYEVALQNARNLSASIQASEAAMKLSDRQLRDTEIRAPFDGYVERRLVNLGELVKAQMPVMAIVRLDPLKVIAEIPERMAPWIDDGRPVELHVDAYPDRTFTGKVTRISPAVNTGTRAFPFEAVVPNSDGALKPGTFARVHVESGKVDEVLTLPFARAAIPIRREPRVRRQRRSSSRCASCRWASGSATGSR